MIAPEGAADILQLRLTPCWGTRTSRTGHGKGKKEEFRGISEFGQSQTLGERKAEEKAGNQGMKRPKQSNMWKRRASKNIHGRCVYSFLWLVKLIHSVGMFSKTDSCDGTHRHWVAVQETRVRTRATARSSARKHVSTPLAPGKGQGDQIHSRPIRTS